MLQVIATLCFLSGIVISKDVEHRWDWLAVKFPQFLNISTNEHDAVSAGWTKDSSCDEKNVYVGNRYIKDNDKSTRLIFGEDGIVAGVQVTVSPLPTYPSYSSSSPWIKVNEDEAIVTVYFRNPKKICKKTAGKPKSTFGHELYIQTKSWLSKGGKKAIKIPKNENKLRKDSAWVKGKCFPGMGLHYWYNVSEDLECKDIFPLFLLYDNTSKQLKSFGWSIPLQVDSLLWEHPPPQYFSLFFEKQDIPKCLMDNTISTQHVYLSDPKTLQCN